MSHEKEHEIEKKWRGYLPLKYVSKFNVQKQPIIIKTDKSLKHQTEQYCIENFYKVVSKIK